MNIDTHLQSLRTRAVKLHDRWEETAKAAHKSRVEADDLRTQLIALNERIEDMEAIHATVQAQKQEA